MHDPERIALDVLRDGIEAGGGRTQAVNYVSAVGADANGVRVRDEVSGEEFSVKTKVVLNTAGPWTDLANAAPLCGYHHRRVHDAEFEHQWLPDGSVLRSAPLA